MTTRITEREWEDLSAYLDGQLSPRERHRLDEKVQARADLLRALDDLRQTRSLLRSQPPLRAPRNFLLTPKMVGSRPAPARTFQLFPVMRLASALAVALFVLVLAGDFVTGGGQPAFVPIASTSLQMAAPAEMKSAPEAAAPQAEAGIEIPAATEAPVEPQLVEKAAQLAAPTAAAAMLESVTGAESYPPPEEDLSIGARSSQDSYATVPAPDVPPRPTLLPQGQENLAEGGAGEVTEAKMPAEEKSWPGWRSLEIALGLLALGAGGIAYYLSRSRRT